MKQSYFNTPRTMDQCTFHGWADPIHIADEQHRPGLDVDSTIAGAVVACIICFGVFFLLRI